MKRDRATKQRRTLATIEDYPSSQELYHKLLASPGWPYKSDMENYLRRDRALVALLYVGCFRISEALRLTKRQFERLQDHIHIKAVKLSKRKAGKIAYRDARLPLKGQRAAFTGLILQYLDTLKEDDRLFPWSLTERSYVIGSYTLKDGTTRELRSFQTVGTKRAWQVVNALLPEYTAHWLRAFGEDFLYDARDHDLLAVADEVKVDARTLQQYLRKRHEKYPAA